MGTYFTFRWKALLDMYRKIFTLKKKINIKTKEPKTTHKNFAQQNTFLTHKMDCDWPCKCLK